MDRKGQGALEYLLLIGGAVLVAVIVITLLLGIADTGSTETEITTAAAMCRNDMALSGRTGDCEQVGPELVNNNSYTCGGIYPNCTATAP